MENLGKVIKKAILTNQPTIENVTKEGNNKTR